MLVKPRFSHLYLLIEFLLLFGGLPLAIFLIKKRWLMIALLWTGSLLCLHMIKKNHGVSFKSEWNIKGLKAGFKEVIIWFFPFAGLIALFTFLHDYQRLFSLPLQHPALWLMVMVLYPMLSVVPQEIIFRSYIFQRYQPLFKSDNGFIILSSLAFSYAHLVFFNWVVFLFTFLGGLLFAARYIKYRSLALDSAEHALYGCLIFTLGLGWYFYGVAWQH